MQARQCGGDLLVANGGQCVGHARAGARSALVVRESAPATRTGFCRPRQSAAEAVPSERRFRVASAPQRRNQRDPRGASSRRQPGVSGRGRKARALTARKRSLHKCALSGPGAIAVCGAMERELLSVSRRARGGRYARRRPLEISPMSFRANAIDIRSASLPPFALNDQAAPGIGLASGVAWWRQGFDAMYCNLWLPLNAGLQARFGGQMLETASRS